jgi:hypothetical protein
MNRIFKPYRLPPLVWAGALFPATAPLAAHGVRMTMAWFHGSL